MKAPATWPHHLAAEVIAVSQIIAQSGRTIVGKVYQRRHEADVRRPILRGLLLRSDIHSHRLAAISHHGVQFNHD